MAVSKSIESRYSPTFDSGHSEKRKTSERQTESLPLIAITVNTSTLKTFEKGTPLTFDKQHAMRPEVLPSCTNVTPSGQAGWHLWV